MAIFSQVTHNKYVFKTTSPRLWPHTFELRAHAKSGVESKPIRTKVILPVMRLPTIRLRRYHVNDDETITWTWKYADGIPEVLGFRIFQDGKLVADEKVLTAKVRKWKSSALPEDKAVSFRIQVVSMYDKNTPISKGKTYEKETE